MGKFKKEEFDFIEQLNKMQTLLTNFEKEETLSEQFPCLEEEEDLKNQDGDEETMNYINLYDVICASITMEGI